MDDNCVDLLNAEVLEAAGVTDSSDSSDSEESATPPETYVKKFQPPVAPENCSFLQHKRTKTLHVVDSRFPRSTGCGRLVSADYVAPSNVRYDAAVCHTCSRHAKKDSFSLS
ncbi:unnamed protein product [Durusdinium trenchii]|uniref:Uncharacterized protein n=2 Tax=Durusdinium trenchii TaxID=1381693 RepID=A0ABP0SAP8_9DINO